MEIDVRIVRKGDPPTELSDQHTTVAECTRAVLVEDATEALGAFGEPTSGFAIGMSDPPPVGNCMTCGALRVMGEPCPSCGG